MAKLKGTTTMRIVIVLTLVLGLLTAASAGLFSESPADDGPPVAEHGPDSASPERTASNQADISMSDGTPATQPLPRATTPGSNPSDTELPQILPMPDTDFRGGLAFDSSDRRGVTRAQLAQLLVDKFDFTADRLLPRAEVEHEASSPDEVQDEPGEVPSEVPVGTTRTEAEVTIPDKTISWRDVAGHPAEAAIAEVASAGVMDGHFDGTFRPDALVTRADVALSLVRVLGLAELAEIHAPAEPKFRDVPVSHQAFTAISMLDRLGMYPFHIGTLFAPDERIELAEVIHTVETARRMELAHGPIVHINTPARTISVERTARHAISYVATENTLIIRNDVPVTIDQLQPGDDVRLFADDTGELLIVVAHGSAPQPTAMSEAVALMRELATPEQLAAIITRDWEQAARELRTSVYNQLVERGATPEEANALLTQDWPVIEERGKVRLTEVIINSTAVDNEELVRAVLDRDWDTALSHLEVEVLEYLLNYLMIDGTET